MNNLQRTDGGRVPLHCSWPLENVPTIPSLPKSTDKLKEVGFWDSEGYTKNPKFDTRLYVLTKILTQGFYLSISVGTRVVRDTNLLLHRQGNMPPF